MKVKKFNISVPGDTYTDREGNEKTKWNNVGLITEFHRDDGTVGRKVEVWAIGMDAQAYPVLPKEDRGERKQQNMDHNADTQQVEYPDVDINPDDIPF